MTLRKYPADIRYSVSNERANEDVITFSRLQNAFDAMKLGVHLTVKIVESHCR